MSGSPLSIYPVYGVQPEGFVRKSLPTILGEIQAAMVTEFGPKVVQTSQSPFGQINGLMADAIAILWEFAEDVYQSYDIDQAEGVRLDMLATLRLMERSPGEGDEAFRLAITNQGRARIDIADITRALKAIEGVTYVHVWLPDATNPQIAQEIPNGTICVAILGGDSEEIAMVLRHYIVPGISTWGNEVVSATIDGYCRSMLILRPILMPVRLDVEVVARRDDLGCPPPSVIAVRDYLVSELTRTFINGDDVTYFRIRSIIESKWPNVEVTSFVGERIEDDMGDEEDSDVDHEPPLINEAVEIAFVELATFSIINTVVNTI